MTTKLNPLETFLTPTEQSILPNLPFSLRNQLEERLLLSRDPNDIECAQRILTLFELPCPLELQGTRESFFTELIKLAANKRLAALDKLFKICQKQGFEPFFRCASTTRIQYYSKETLLEIIDFFTTIANANSNLSCLSSFPRYEAEGKLWLEQLKKNPDLSIFSCGHVSPSSSNLLLPPTQQLDDVFKESSSFEKTKALVLRYLTSLSVSNRLPMDTYLKIFHNIQNIPKFAPLPEISKICLLKLILSTTSKPKEETKQLFFNEDLDELLEEILANHICWGEQFLIIFCNAPDMQKHPSIDDVIRTFKLSNLLGKETRLAVQVQENLQSFGSGLITLEEFITSLETLAPEALKTIPKETEDLEVLQKRMQGDDPNVVFPLPEGHLETVKRQYVSIEKYCAQYQGYRLGQLIALAMQIRAKGMEKGFQEEDLLQLIAVGRLVAFIKFQLYARSTQIYTILGELCFEKGAMAQVKTGEGKSLIITLLGFVLSMQNKSLHVISSDPVLAQRDQRKAAVFFDPFKVSTSNICGDHPKPQQFNAQILYGTASDFEFAVMKELLYFQPYFTQKPSPEGKKRFDYVLIDEVDNLTIDTASSNARLSSSREETYEWVYLPIFHFVKDNFSREDSDTVSTGDSIERLRKLLEKYSHGTFKSQVHQFANQQLQTWLTSAFHALYELKVKQDYVLLPNPHKEQDGNEKRVVIADKGNTDRLMHASRWSNGIHEFVEVKHQMMPRRESLCPISLSHPVFYQMYQTIHGLSGTLGSSIERKEIKKLYDIFSFDIPTFCPIRRKDYPTVIVPTQNVLLQKIRERVEQCKTQRRPVLVLCNSIQKSEEVALHLKNAGIPFELLNELQEKSDEVILDKAGLPGAVTVATNTAGRGTDIILKEDSDANGGLHVLITFYPKSKRVEDQGIGRAGRQGQNGSSEIIICKQDLDSIPPGLRDQQVLDLLDQQRTFHTKVDKQLHLLQAEAEHHIYSFVRQFYEWLGNFEALLKNERFIESAAFALSKRKIHIDKVVDLEGLKPKDRQISVELLKLFTDSNQSVVSWKTLLLQIGKRIIDRSLNLWALDFYQKIDHLMQEANGESQMNVNFRLQTAQFTNTGHPIDLLFQGLEQALVEEERERIATLKEKITDLYQQTNTNWQQLLHPSGFGILHYIRENTQTVLSGLEDEITII